MIDFMFLILFIKGKFKVFKKIQNIALFIF